MSLVHQHLGLAVGQPRQRNPQLDFDTKSLRDRADPDRALYRDFRWDREGVARRDVLYGAQEARRVPSGKQLLRVGATSSGTPEFARRRELLVQHTVG